MIPGSSRFHGHNSLRYVYTNGKSVRSQLLTVKWVRNTRRRQSRISVVVSRKILKGAVGRNRIRRRVYEYVRTNLDRFNNVYDVVIIATSPELRTIAHPELADTLERLFTQAELYKTS